MEKEELLEQFDDQIVNVGKVLLWLRGIHDDPLLSETFHKVVIGMLMTACDYLLSNLNEMRNKYQMS